MGNIIDYVREYGKYTLDEEPFNEVDSLILSQFAYLKFDELMLDYRNACTPIYVNELREHRNYETLFADTRFEKVNRELAEAMADSRRFAGVHLFDYVNIVDAQWEIQFSAITCVFENGFVYIAYRGTDETLIGWKEDFNMAFMTPVPAQQKAVQYLNRMLINVNTEVTIGGHSKGGNLAVYAAMMCMDSVRDKIAVIYSHDGPGFNEDAIDESAFEKIHSRIRKSVPRSSIVGMVLKTIEDYEVVKSRNVGFLQHDPYNWIIEGKEFKKADNIHRHIYVGDESVNRWVANMDYEKRQEFVEMLFDVLRCAGLDNLSDYDGDLIKAGRSIKRAVDDMNSEDKAIFMGLLKNMSETVNETVREYVTDQLSEEMNKYRRKIKRGADKLNNGLDQLFRMFEEEHK